MTTRDDILAAALAWLQVGSQKPTDPALTDQQVIRGDQAGPRPAKPYLTYKLLTFDIERGTDDEIPSIAAAPGSEPQLVIRGERGAVLSVQGFGSETSEWLQRAKLRLRHESIKLLNDGNGISVEPAGGSTDIASVVDTAFEDRFTQEFDITYQIATEPELLVEAATTETAVTLEGQTSDFDLTVIA